MRRPLTIVLLLLASALTGHAAPAPVAGWRDMLRDYRALHDSHTDCLARFPGFDPEMARLGEAFARNAYPANPDLGRKNFRRLALRLNLSHPDDDARTRLFVPNKSPWPEYKGAVDSDGLTHFVFNTGTLPMPLLDHPIVAVVRRHDVDYGRVKPIAQCAARVLRAESADMTVVEHDRPSRDALVSKIRKTFDAENKPAPMNDEEARCLAECLPYMT